MTISERKCAYGCGASVESPDGYAWGGVPLNKCNVLRHLSDKRLDLACGHCYTTKAMKGITVDGYGR